MPQNTNGQIANPVPSHQQQQKGPEMNDRDRLNDILATEKYLTDSFNISVREASHDQLHQELMTILSETHRAARDVYNLMFQYGWYKVEAEQQQKIDQAHQQFQGYTGQFPYPSVQ